MNHAHNLGVCELNKQVVEIQSKVAEKKICFPGTWLSGQNEIWISKNVEIHRKLEKIEDCGLCIYCR